MKKNIYLPDEAATETLAAKIVEALPEDITGWIVLLQGDLGAGKSTLMKLITGSVEPDEGSLWVAPGVEVSYMPQSLTINGYH